MKRTTKKSCVQGMLLLAMVVVAGVLAACNTTAGVGRDIKAAGSGLENAAEKAK